MRVLPSPLKLGWRSQVSLVSRYGTCPDLEPSDTNTLVKALKLLLIATASFASSPLTPERFNLSLPAKSHKLSIPLSSWLLSAWTAVRCSVKTLCERLETSFIFVLFTVLYFAALFMTSSTACLSVGSRGTMERSVTRREPSGLTLISCFFSPISSSRSKSLMVSL